MDTSETLILSGVMRECNSPDTLHAHPFSVPMDVSPAEMFWLAKETYTTEVPAWLA